MLTLSIECEICPEMCADSKNEAKNFVAENISNDEVATLSPNLVALEVFPLDDC